MWSLNLCSILTCILLPHAIVGCRKKKSILKDKAAANGADKKTGANAQEKRMDEAPTQEEDSLDLDLQPTQQLSLKQGKRKGTIVGYKSAGPDERALTIVAPTSQKDPHATKSMDLLDPLKEKSLSKHQEDKSPKVFESLTTQSDTIEKVQQTQSEIVMSLAKQQVEGSPKIVESLTTQSEPIEKVQRTQSELLAYQQMKAESAETKV